MKTKFACYCNWAIIKIYELLTLTPLQGAQTTLFCCLDDAVASESGSYYSGCGKKTLKVKESSDDPARLWSISERLVEKFLDK